MVWWYDVVVWCGGMTWYGVVVWRGDVVILLSCPQTPSELTLKNTPTTTQIYPNNPPPPPQNIPQQPPKYTPTTPQIYPNNPPPPQIYPNNPPSQILMSKFVEFEVEEFVLLGRGLHSLFQPLNVALLLLP